MSRPDVDEVVNYLSIKFKKIFCDREFVCCVIEDFKTVLDNRGKICVLVFPTLGPIYLKALRYQARIFDLAVFNIASPSGKFKSIAVCHKDHLKKPNTETMSESVKRKRPERQLYVPPAQRVSRLSGKSEKKVQPLIVENPSEQCFSDCVLNLCDVVNLVYFFNTLPCEFGSSGEVYQHDSCQFQKFLKFKQFDSSLNYDYFIKIYDNFILLNNIRWKLNQLKYFNHSKGLFKSYPVFNFENLQTIADTRQGVLVSNDVTEFQKFVSKLVEYENTFYKVECDMSCDEVENCCIVDLSILELGHFFIISIEDSDHFHECQEKHDVTLCCQRIKEQLQLCKQLEKLNSAMNDSQNNEEMNKNRTNETMNKSRSKEPERKSLDKNGTDKVSKNNKDVVRNKKNKKKASDNTHEQEKEIMRMTKEFINRKTRPIMKYVDDSNDTLQIDTNESVNNWEDLFDDNGQIQEELLTEIVDKVGDDITIVKANEDYTDYTNKPPEELEHIVELYNFPSTLETHDLVQAFSDINSDAMYIKWVDDTHALLVLGSLSQAQKAINMGNPLIKVRPMTAASAMSMDVANKSDLRPAMKRPPTNLQTARRLITSHLGTKSKLSKEQIAKEKEDLKNAREMKRLLKQNEKDAWEGKLRSSVN